MAANNIYIQVDFNSQQAQANVNALNNAIQQTGPTAQKTSAEATQGLNSVQVSVQQTTKAFEEMTAALAGLGIARLAQNIIQVGSELNRAQQAMAAFVGSAAEAAEVTDKIAAIAAQSPFRFKDLEESARRLAGFGVTAQQVPTWIKIISDQVAAMGGSMENVNNIVTLFGRVLNKEFVGAMDLMRMLPGQGIKVGEALAKAFGKESGGVEATMRDVQKEIKAGALDPMNVLLVMLGAMQSKTAGAGAAMQDFEKVLKNIGDAFDRVYQDLTSEKGFGPALRVLGQEIQVALLPIAALVKFLMDLPEPVKVALVTIAALAAVVITFGNAWKLFSMLASPAITVLKGLATAVKELYAAVIADNPVVLAAIAAIGLTLAGLALTFPDQAKKVLDWMSGIWEKIKATATAIGQQIGILPKEVKLASLEQPGSIFKQTDLEEVQKQVQEWSDAAGKTMLQALSSPAEAVQMKYKDLFAKLQEQIDKLHITPQYAKELTDQLTAAQRMEMDAKLFEKRKTQIEETYKFETEKAKGSYDAQIEYIEAMDEQDLRKKVANIDHITDLRVESAETVKRLEDKQLEDIYNAQVKYLEDHRKLFEDANINVNAAELRLQDEMLDKQKVINQKAIDDEQKYRLEGWKKANDAIIEDQKRVFEGFKSMFDDIFDALTGKTKNIGQAMADVFKKLALDQAKELFSSGAAGFATQLAGYGAPETQIGKSGILASLFQRGMPPRAPGPPPGGYIPAITESGIAGFPDVMSKGGANRSIADIANAGNVYNVSSIIFDNAVTKFADATVQHQGSADRMADSADDITDAISRASQATGVPQSVLTAVARQESGLRTGLTSGRGAQGLFQLMPATQQDWGVTNPFDPYQSAMAGAEQLQRLMTHYGGNLPQALAAYNYGQAATDRALAAGRPLPAETQAYVKGIMGQLGGGGGGGGGAGGGFNLWDWLTGRQLSPFAANPPAPPSQAQPIQTHILDWLTGKSLTPATREFQLPAGFSYDAANQLQYDPALAAATAPAQPQLPMPPDIFGGWGTSVTTAAAPTQIEQAKKQSAVLASLLGISAGAIGLRGGAGGGGGQQQGGLAGLLNVSKLSTLFGIGVADKGATTIQSVLGSKGVAQIAALGGAALIGTGLNKRVAPLTVAGGGLMGLQLANQPLPGGAMLGPLGGVMVGAGGGLLAAGVQRGGFGGMGMDIGGGALVGGTLGFAYGGPMGALIGAGIGAAAGAIAGVVRLFVKTEQEKIRAQIKQVYGIDISNRQILTQIQQIVDQKYGGNVAVGIRSTDVQDLVRLYALSTGQAANMPRPMYAATIAQSTQGLQLQPVYHGGVQVQNPYTGTTTYQYQTAVAQAQGLMPQPGSGLGVPGGAGLINQSFQQLALATIQGNPSAIGQASAAAASAGDSRLTTTQAMQEPLTALS